MFNQVVLVGRVKEIYDDHIDLGVSIDPRDREDEIVIPIQMSENLIAHLLLDNVCGIKGRIDMKENLITIVCDRLTVLDARGKSNEGN